MSSRIAESKSLSPHFVYLLSHHGVNDTYANAFSRDPSLRVNALTALDYACRVAVDFDLVRALVAEGATPVVPFNYEGYDPLSAAVEGGSYGILSFLVDQWNEQLPTVSGPGNLRMAGLRALVSASRLGRDDMVELLLANGAKINYEDESTYSPLAVALSACPYNPRVTELLVRHGADYYFRASYRYQADGPAQPVFFASRNGAAVRQLASMGCDFSRECERGSFLRATLERRRYGRRPGEWLTILEALASLAVRDNTIWQTTWPENYEHTLLDLGFADSPYSASRYIPLPTGEPI